MPSGAVGPSQLETNGIQQVGQVKFAGAWLTGESDGRNVGQHEQGVVIHLVQMLWFTGYRCYQELSNSPVPVDVKSWSAAEAHRWAALKCRQAIPRRPGDVARGFGLAQC